MTTLQVIIGYLATGLLWVALAGIVRKRRYREWILFPIFVFAVAFWGTLVIFWNTRFHGPELWMAKEGVHHILRVAMALELAMRTFRAFPGAMATLKRVVFMLMVVTIGIVLTTAPAALKYESFIGVFQPRVVAAAIWLFTGIAILILWYRLPVSRFQKAIVLSYVLYLPILAAYMNLLAGLGWQRGRLIGYLHQFSYLALASFWAYVCWRTEKPHRPEEDEPAILS
jgi:hypothetical protein